MSVEEEIIIRARGIVLDLGCGKGAWIKKLTLRKPTIYPIGLDININSLRELNITDKVYDLIYSDISTIPIRDDSVNSILVIGVLHEVSLDSVDMVLMEVKRVLRVNGEVFFIDKVRKEDFPINEALPIYTENLYLKVLRLVKGIKALGVKNIDKLLSLFRKFSFKISMYKEVKFGEKISGDVFLKMWGRETKNLAKTLVGIPRFEVERDIERIENFAKQFGYGPTNAVFLILKK